MSARVIFHQLPEDTEIPGAWIVAVLDVTARALTRLAGVAWTKAEGDLGPVSVATGQAGDEGVAFGLEAHGDRRGVYVFGPDGASPAALGAFIRSLCVEPVKASAPDGSPLFAGASFKRPLVSVLVAQVRERMEELRPAVEEAERLRIALAALQQGEAPVSASVEEAAAPTDEVDRARSVRRRAPRARPGRHKRSAHVAGEQPRAVA